MRSRRIALALVVGGVCLALVASANAPGEARVPAPLTTAELRPYLETLIEAVGEESPEDAEYSRLTRFGVGGIFAEALGKRVLSEIRLKQDPRLRLALTVLALEFAELLPQYALVPPAPLGFRPEKAPKPGPETARLNYARLARGWYDLGHTPRADYPQKLFTELRDAGFGVAYPEPNEGLSRYDYAARLLRILVLESGNRLMEKAGPEVIAASLDLLSEMNAVVGDASGAMRILRQLLLPRADKQAGDTG